MVSWLDKYRSGSGSGDKASDADEYRRSTRRSVHGCRAVMGGVDYTVLDLSEHGFSVASKTTPPLKGVFEIYQDGKLVKHCLCMYVWGGCGVIGYEFKDKTRILEI